MALRLSEGLGIAAAPRPKPANSKRSKPKKTNGSGNADYESKAGFHGGGPDCWGGACLQLVLAGKSEYSIGRECAKQTTDYGWPK